MSALTRTTARLRAYFGDAPRIPWAWEWVAFGCIILAWAWQAQAALLCAALGGAIVTWRSWSHAGPGRTESGTTGWAASLGALLYTILLLSPSFLGITGPILCLVLAAWKPRLFVYMSYMSASIMLMSVYSPRAEDMLPGALVYAMFRIWVRRPGGRWRAGRRITWL